MNTVALWILGSIGVFIGLILLIGIIAILIQFCIKRFRKRPWSDITSPPVTSELSENSRWSWSWTRSFRRTGTDRERILHPRNDVIVDIPEPHVTIPVNETDASANSSLPEQQDPTQSFVQAQRDRLVQLKDERQRSTPMISIIETENQVQSAIDQVQKEFDESF